VAWFGFLFCWFEQSCRYAPTRELAIHSPLQCRHLENNPSRHPSAARRISL